MTKRSDSSGAVYRRGRTWWIWYRVEGERIFESAKTADKRVASALLAQRRRELREGSWTHPTATGPAREAERLRARLEELAPQIEAQRAEELTVERYAETWLARRRAAGVLSVEEDALRLSMHVLPRIGSKPLASVTRSDVRDVMSTMQSTPSKRTGRPYAARSVLSVYTTVRAMFSDAVKDEVLTSTPCTLATRRGELPALRDADPLWRVGAVYTRDEAEALISDERVPHDRRVLYALMLLGGLRIGEAIGRRWRDLDSTVEPLGRMTVATQIARNGRERPTKTGDTRQVPIHPTLASVLAAWKLAFPVHFGRHPRPDDFVVPSTVSDELGPRSKASLKSLKADLDRLGLRSTGRAQHAMRATFLSLLQADGANMGIASRVTHAPPSDVLGGYLRASWADTCAEVVKLRLEVRRVAKVIPMRRAAGSDPSCYNPCDSRATPHASALFSGTKSVEVMGAEHDPNSRTIPGLDSGGAFGIDAALPGAVAKW